jgi:hypothetical protein
MGSDRSKYGIRISRSTQSGLEEHESMPWSGYYVSG